MDDDNVTGMLEELTIGAKASCLDVRYPLSISIIGTGSST